VQKKPPRCPDRSAPLIKRALADSDERVSQSWWRCTECSWDERIEAVMRAMDAQTEPLSR
jgi:hypothetical protein